MAALSRYRPRKRNRRRPQCHQSSVAAGRLKRGLPYALRNCGYRTYSLYSWSGAFAGARNFHTSAGIEHFLDSKRLGSGPADTDGFYYDQLLIEGRQCVPLRVRSIVGLLPLLAVEILEEDAEPTALDAAIICAAQKVEHYEIAAYTTARNLALQLRQHAIVQLLTMSLGEEQNAGQLLDQVAQPLMSVAKMPVSVE